MSNPIWVGWCWLKDKLRWAPLVTGDDFLSTLERLQQVTGLKSDGLMVLRYGTGPTDGIGERFASRDPKPRKKSLIDQHAAVLRLLLDGPQTASYVRKTLGLFSNTASNRLMVLQKAQRVRLVGQVRISGNQGLHNVWEVTDTGREALENAEKEMMV